MKARIACYAIADIRDSEDRRLLIRKDSELTPLGGPIKATWFRTEELLKRFGVRGANRGSLSFELVDHMVIPGFVEWFQKRSERNTSVRDFLKPLLTEADILNAAALKKAKEKFAGFNLLPLKLGRDTLWTTCLFEVYSVNLGPGIADKLAWKSRHSRSNIKFATQKEIEDLRTRGAARISPFAAALLEPRTRLG